MCVKLCLKEATSHERHAPATAAPPGTTWSRVADVVSRRHAHHSSPHHSSSRGVPVADTLRVAVSESCVFPSKVAVGGHHLQSRAPEPQILHLTSPSWQRDSPCMCFFSGWTPCEAVVLFTGVTSRWKTETSEQTQEKDKWENKEGRKKQWSERVKAKKREQILTKKGTFCIVVMH